ncbi:hypothetical protein [Rhizorhabdus argentea]|uniref:hypothetical protein n=1 Tax=Rhizorhabdus argentea TaxID=1387174 RepID=UPI0030EEAE43
MPPFLYQLIYLLALVSACSYAGWIGGWPERAGAAIMVTGSILSLVVASHREWQSPELGIFIIDLLVLAAFVNLTLYSDRYWPIWVTSFHLIAVTIHVASLADPTVASLAYASAQEFWAYPMLVGIAIGTWNHRRRQASLPTRGNAARY